MSGGSAKKSQAKAKTKPQHELVTMAAQSKKDLVSSMRALNRNVALTRQETARGLATDLRGVQQDVQAILRPQAPNPRDVEDLLNQVRDEVALGRKYPGTKK
jgi:hypothetical protein